MANETELVFYAKVGNPDGLSQANSWTEQVQYEGRIDDNRRHRVRGEKDPQGNVTFTYTSKLFKGNETGVTVCDEKTGTISEEAVDAFVPLADRVLYKRRYIFLADKTTVKLANGTELVIPGVKYEVDVYRKQDDLTHFSEWCKIDVELDGILAALKNHVSEGFDIDDTRITLKLSVLPFEPTEIIDAANASEEQKAFTKELWDKVFAKSLQGTET